VVRRHATLRALRVALVVVGLVAGALLPILTPQSARTGLIHAATFITRDALAIVVQAAYGALAGWAIGALIAHLRGHR
jgi:type II secretory pathway pseudopilin PulG